jgi:hypothetical protein
MDVEWVPFLILEMGPELGSAASTMDLLPTGRESKVLLRLQDWPGRLETRPQPRPKDPDKA